MLMFLAIILCLFAFFFLIGLIKMYSESNRISEDIGIYITDSNGKLIILDVETNGLNCNKSSVLSCSAIKYTIKNIFELHEEERFHRFYFPKESFNHKATDINGLTEYRISELRANVSYSTHFINDRDFRIFCEGIYLFVGHNIDFDLSFVSYLVQGNRFCTMKTNAPIVRVKWMESKNEWKWPTLEETAKFYRIPASSGSFHDSMFDIEITAKIFLEMLRRFYKKAKLLPKVSVSMR